MLEEALEKRGKEAAVDAKQSEVVHTEVTLQALRRLSMIILSKEGSVDSSAISIVKKALGENFTQLMQAHETEIQQKDAEVLREREHTRARS